VPLDLENVLHDWDPLLTPRDIAEKYESLLAVTIRTPARWPVITHSALCGVEDGHGA
jgi:hypothetical protein